MKGRDERRTRWAELQSTTPTTASEHPSLLSDAVDGVGHAGFGGPFDDSLETYVLAGEGALAITIPESSSGESRVFSSTDYLSNVIMCSLKRLIKMSQPLNHNSMHRLKFLRPPGSDGSRRFAMCL